MGIEIERKFKVFDNTWKPHIIDSFEIVQAYISCQPAVRVRTFKNFAALTVKSSNSGMTRKEFEYPIPYEDAVDMIEMYQDTVVSKIRYIVKDPKTGQLWEIDEFRGGNSGLLIAEIELASEDEQINNHHSWLGTEVTNDIRYYNAYLARLPYCDWDNDWDNEKD